MTRPWVPEERALREALKMCGLNRSDLPALERFRRSGGISAIQKIGVVPPVLAARARRRDRKLKQEEEQRVQQLHAKEEALARRARRAEVFADLYVSGMTLQEIGSLYGLGRERVRQVIMLHTAATGLDIRSAKKEPARQKEATARLKKRGVMM